MPRETVREWDMLSLSEKLRYLWDRSALYLILGLVPGLLYALVAWLARGGYDVRVLLVALGGGLLLGVLLRGLGLARVIRGSRRRMADPMYRARLVEFGMASQAERR